MSRLRAAFSPPARSSLRWPSPVKSARSPDPSSSGACVDDRRLRSAARTAAGCKRRRRPHSQPNARVPSTPSRPTRDAASASSRFSVRHRLSRPVFAVLADAAPCSSSTARTCGSSASASSSANPRRRGHDRDAIWPAPSPCRSSMTSSSSRAGCAHLPGRRAIQPVAMQDSRVRPQRLCRLRACHDRARAAPNIGACVVFTVLPSPRYMCTPQGRQGSKLRTVRMMSMPLNLSGPFSSKIGVFCTASS